MTGNSHKFYWDTCIFLAWLKNEVRKNGEMSGVSECVERFEKRDASLVTSVITIPEILYASLPAGSSEMLEHAMQRSNFTRVSVDIKIARLARELREYYWRQKEQYNNKTLSVPDSIHLATAIIYKVDAFHTFDENNRSKTLGLIPLSGNIAGHQMIIEGPRPESQLPLPLSF